MLQACLPGLDLGLTQAEAEGVNLSQHSLPDETCLQPLPQVLCSDAHFSACRKPPGERRLRLLINILCSDRHSIACRGRHLTLYNYNFC